MEHLVRLFHGMRSASPAMHQIFDQVERAGRSGATVLVRGETGTGKELVAKALHATSDRADRPFLAVNCATLTGDLLASELFGHVRGAFTGAVRKRAGLFARADGGTVFLDEIAELPLNIQPRLLRVLQEQRFTPVGSSDSIAVDVRVISATHRALRQEVAAGRFRSDLMFRIRVAPIFIPPLRDRPEDVDVLLEHFMELLHTPDRTLTRIDPDALAALRAYDWPGNVRELRNVVESALALGVGEALSLADLPPELRGVGPTPTAPLLQSEIRRRARNRILEALAESEGNKTRAARALGMARSTLWRKMRELGLQGG